MEKLEEDLQVCFCLNLSHVGYNVQASLACCTVLCPCLSRPRAFALTAWVSTCINMRRVCIYYTSLITVVGVVVIVIRVSS